MKSSNTSTYTIVSKSNAVDILQNDQDPNTFWPASERKTWLFAIFAGTLFLYAARTALPICAVDMATDLSWGKESEGLILSAFFWGYATTQILGGLLSDIFGGERILGISALLWSILTLAIPIISTSSLPLVGSSSGVFIARVLTGVCQGVHYPSMSSLMAKKIPSIERASSSSFVTAGAPFGTVFSGSLGSVILSMYGWHAVFYVFGAFGLFWAVIWRHYFIKPMESQNSYITNGILRTRKKSSSENSKPSLFSVPWRQIFKEPAVWALMTTHMCSAMLFNTLLSWLPTYFRDNFPDKKGWIFNVVPWLVMFIFTVAGGLASDYSIKCGYSVAFTRKLFQTSAVILSSVFLLLLDYCTLFEEALFCMVMTVGAQGFQCSGSLINPQDISPTYAGCIFGVMNCLGAVSGVFGIFIAGVILEKWQSWSAVFHLDITISIIGNVVFLIWGKGSKLL